MTRRSHRLVCLAASAMALQAGAACAAEALPPCGKGNDWPLAAKVDGGRRPCPEPGPRTYVPHHSGRGFVALDLESEACFVPDAAYALLDAIVDDVRAAAQAEGIAGDRKPAALARLSAMAMDVLERRGFRLWFGTETLGDALHSRGADGGPPLHLIDCDTGSLILLTIADALGIDAAWVEITLASGATHNYVRWLPQDTDAFDWDINARGRCNTPRGLRPGEGEAMDAARTRGYLLYLRGGLWRAQGRPDLALADYRESLGLDPGRPNTLNNFAWLVATREVPGREGLAEHALSAAAKALEATGLAAHRDTLACALALTGRFGEAAAEERRALSGRTGKAAMRARLAGFLASPPRDCTGAE